MPFTRNFSKFFLLFHLLFIFWATPAISTSTGSLTLRNQMLQALEHYGPAQLTTTKIKNHAAIHGPLLANDVKLTSLELHGPLNGNKMSFQQGIIHGPVELSNSKISGLVTIYGPVNATHCQFGEMVVSTEKVQFQASTIKNITIAKDNRAIPKIQQVILQNSQVTETLVFESGQGEVILLDSQSHVMDIVGGKIVRQKK